MAKDDKRIEEVEGVPPERQGTRPDFTVPPPRKKLPKSLQDTLDNEEKLWEVLYDGTYVHQYLSFLYPIHPFQSIGKSGGSNDSANI